MSLDQLREMAKRGADLDQLDGSNRTMLMRAAYHDDLPVVEFLVEWGADLEDGDFRGSTALMSAAQRGNFAVVRYLLEKGANVEAKDDNANTALILAASDGDLATVEALVERGASLEAKTIEGGSTPLIAAAYRGNLSVVEYLVEKGANIQAEDNFLGYNALTHAVVTRRPPVVAYLCAQGADVHARNKYGRAAIHEIGQTQNAFEVIAILLNYGADLSSTTRKGETALQLLAGRLTQGDEAAFLEKALHSRALIAVKAGDLAGVRRLVEDEGISVDHHDDSKLLIHAAQRGDFSIFEYLVEHGTIMSPDEEIDASVAAMLQHRRDWVDQVGALGREWRVPLTAIRTIHEYVVGFNWSVVCEALMQKARSGVCRNQQQVRVQS